MDKSERARRKRALSYFQRVLVCWIYVWVTTPFVMAATSCAVDHVDEHVQVAYVHDGDTVGLRDGRKLRLIGIDTPELGRNGEPDQAYAVEARDALRAMLVQRPELDLRLDETRHDVHGRLLAHAFLADGTSLSAWLLERGYATILVVPPNNWHDSCYQAAEQHARDAGLGIWALPNYQPIPSARLQPTTRGYHLIKGRVIHIGESAHSVWLDLEGAFAARIDRQDLNYFDAVALHKLLHKDVIVRGWVYAYHNEMQLRLRYPVDLEILDR